MLLARWSRVLWSVLLGWLALVMLAMMVVLSLVALPVFAFVVLPAWCLLRVWRGRGRQGPEPSGSVPSERPA